MKKAKSWIILTLVCYLLFLFWTLPAQYVWSFLAKRQVLPAGSVAMAGIDGAWSAGRILKLKTGGLELSNLRWRFQPLGLLAGRLQVAVAGEVADGKLGGVLRVGADTVRFEEIQGQIPVASLGRVYLPGVELAGVMQFTDLALTGKDGRLLAGSGQLVWRNAEVHSPYRMELGGVMVELATESDRVLFKLKDLGGGLRTSGLGFLTPEGKYSFDGTVGVRQGSSPELATFLQILGRPGADGMVKINYKGQLPSFF
jgi:general secretion pathway protein N